MRIGLLTYHSVCNFGANLQALSTVSYLRNMGCNPIVINWMPKDLERQLWARVPEIQAQTHRNFATKHLPTTRLCSNDDDIAAVIQEDNIEAVIIGSDAVLKQTPLLSRIRFPAPSGIALAKVGRDCEYPNPFWGRFVDRVPSPLPLALMSASSQNTQYRLIPRRTRRLMEQDLRRFAYLSVRDNWTADMVRFITSGKINPVVTPDPVFAFNYNVPERQSKKDLLTKFGLSEKYVLISFSRSNVSPEWMKTFEELAKNDRTQCVALAMPKGVRFEHRLEKTIDVPLDPMDWYGLIRHSSGYVGHNMHPIVVALHNSVPFFSFDNYGITHLRILTNEKSSKIFHLLEEAGFLKNRCSALSKIPSIVSPNVVFESLRTFDRKRCAVFSRAYYERYCAMMAGILGIFQERLKATG